MRYKAHLLLTFLFFASAITRAQKPFAEGTIVYKVTLRAADNKGVSGIYTFTIKGAEIRKELKMNNGYQDIVLLNCQTNKVYSLQNRAGKKYAIQLSMEDLQKRQDAFAGYTMKDEAAGKPIAGYASYKGNISYKDGSMEPIVYTKDWSPAQAIMFERFPSARFLPMYFSYKDENNMVMQFDVDKIEPGPVETAVFRIPPDYKMISYNEYKQLSK